MATAKRKTKASSIGELIDESRRLWEQYCDKPTMGNLQKFLKHKGELDRYGREWASGRVAMELDAIRAGLSDLWGPIPGFPLYEVSAMGRVRSYKGANQNSPPRKRPKLLKTRPGDGGYVRVTLQNEDGQKQVIPVHLLVARAFSGPPRGRVVRHMDGDPSNPRLDNLKYGTQLENNEDKRRHGTLLLGEDNLSSLISEDEAKEIYALKGAVNPDTGRRWTQQDIADQLGISRQAVSDIHRGISWAESTGHVRRGRS